MLSHALTTILHRRADSSWEAPSIQIWCMDETVATLYLFVPKKKQNRKTDLFDDVSVPNGSYLTLSYANGNAIVMLCVVFMCLPPGLIAQCRKKGSMKYLIRVRETRIVRPQDCQVQSSTKSVHERG